MAILASPEFLTVFLALALLALYLFQKNIPVDLAPGLTFGGAFAILLISFALPPSSESALLNSLFNEYMGKYGEFITYRSGADGLSLFGSRLLLVCLLLTVLSSWEFIKKRGRPAFEYYSLLTFSTAGLIFMVNSREFITFLISLEVSALALYGLSAYFIKDKISVEAGIKYLLIGASFSGILLYSIVLIYGASGTTSYDQLALLSNAILSGERAQFLLFACLLLCTAFAFKLGMAPFHFWMPDVFQGSPTPIAGYLSVAPKVAGFLVLIRLLDCLIPLQGEQGKIFIHFFLCLAVFSMILGNLIAIAQKNIKRMMAYSSIGQVGYLAMGIIAANHFGLAAILFFLVSYVFSNLAVFGVIASVSQSDFDDTQDFRGLGRRNPFLAMVLLLGILSLSGIPPMSGFFAKLYVFSAAIKAKYYLLVFLAMIATTVSLYYYLNVLRLMYIEEPEPDPPTAIQGVSTRFGLWLCLLGMLYFGLFPADLVEFCIEITSNLSFQ